MSNVALSRTEIHEINEYRPPSAPGAYKILKWKPVYDMIVAGHILGRSNKELAEAFDFTSVHISNILRCDHAQSLIKAAHDRIREVSIEQSGDNVSLQVEIQTKALERVRDFVNNDKLAYESPFPFLDRIKDLAKGSLVAAPLVPATSSVTVNVQQNNQTNQIREESMKRIADALDITNE